MSTVTVSAAQTRVKTSELEIEHVRIPEPAFAPAGTKGVTIISSLTLAHGHADSWTTLCRALAHLATARPESHGRTHRSFHRKTRSKADRVHQWLNAAQVAMQEPRLNAFRSSRVIIRR
jgi:hypothetical protein